jgi:hypothetical protein
MKSANSLDKEIIKQYSKAIVHMRKQIEREKFGLILGAGISRSFNMPTWKELLDLLARHDKVRGAKVDRPNETPTSRAEILYRLFSEQRRNALSHAGLNEHGLERRIKGEWFEIIRSILYAKLPDRDDLDRSHGYLGEFLDIISRSPLTVNYNFDSCIEMMLSARQKRNKDPNRLYETIYDGSLPFRSKTGIIYHPNGFLPDNVLEGFSDELVFSEKSFGDQLLESMAGRYYSLAHHLSKNTCLFIGLSFDDENLRHLLRRSATTNPGHYHYCVYWISPGERRNKQYEAALAEYRFEIYNLITLFFRDEEIAALGRLLGYGFEELQALAEESNSELTWIYYLTGIPGIGKTSVTRYMQGLAAYDEWLEEPLPLLNEPFTELGKKQENTVNEWVARQFALKNERLLREREGIFLIDRAPLDPLSFEERDHMPAKAAWYGPRLRQGDMDRTLRSGRVLLLVGNTDDISTRLSRRKGEISDSHYLDDLQAKLRLIYESGSVRIVPTNDLSLLELVKQIARIIHREQQSDVNLEELLQSVEKGAKAWSGKTLKAKKGKSKSTSRHRSSTSRKKPSTKS